MSDTLYFIRILMEAMAAGDRRSAIREALRRIEEMGQAPEYRQGYAQFLDFMREAVEEGPGAEEDDAAALAAELAGGVFDGDAEEERAALVVVLSDPVAKAAYREYLDDLGAEPVDVRDARLELHSDSGDILCERPRAEDDAPSVFEDVPPGRYELRSGLGRLLWRGELLPSDLVWSAAFPGRALPAAAETCRERRDPAREIEVLSGRAVIRVFPGIDRGLVEVRFISVSRR